MRTTGEFGEDHLQTETADARANGNGNGHASENIKLEILKLAALGDAEYQQTRRQKAKELDLTLKTLDGLVKKERKRIKADGEAAKRQQRQARQNSSDWRHFPDVTNEGKVRARSQTNIDYFLKRQGVSLNFDMMAYRALITRDGVTSTLTDETCKGLWLEADRKGLQAKDSYFFAVLENIARKNSFHPVINYLNGLQWDGHPRLDKWLHSYFGAEDTPLSESDALNDGRDFISSEEIYGVLGIPIERRGGETGKRVATIMRGLGFVHRQKRIERRPSWGYRRVVVTGVTGTVTGGNEAHL
jgi:hypothetical protein